MSCQGNFPLTALYVHLYQKQFNMKKLFYLLVLSLVAFSCGDDKKTEEEVGEDTTPPGKVTKVTSRPGYGTVTLKWSRPTDGDYGYTAIEFTRKGESVALQARDSITITGFEDTQPYEFSLFATDKNQNRADAVKITETPRESPSSMVESTIVLIQNGMLASFSWENVTGSLVTVTVNYTDADGNPKTASKMSTVDRDHISIDMPAKQQTVNVVVASGSVTQPAKEILVKHLPDRRKWTVTDVSSEELTGEGSANGHAIHAIDGSTSTYWHTKWSGSYVPTLPNYVVYDMQENVALSYLKVIQRSTGKSLNTVEILLGPDADNLTQAGSLTFPDANGGSQEITFDPPVSGRILKLNMPDSRHSGNHCMIAEIEIEGTVVVE